MGRKLTGQEWAELVNRAQKGEETGFEELYRSSYDYLYAVCIKSNVSEEDIPDVLQEAYIKVFKNIGSLADPEKFLGWAAMVVKNTGRDRGRQRKTYYERNEFMEGISTDDNVGLDTLAVDEMDPEYNPGVAMDRAATVQIVRDMIAELPDTQRDCIILWCEGLNMKDISDEVGIPVGSVKSSISYAKQKIRKMTIRIEQEQRIRLHTVAPMSFFIWAVQNMQDLLEIAPGDFSGIERILVASGQIVTDSVANLSDTILTDIENNNKTNAAQDSSGKNSAEVAQNAMEQTVPNAGKEAIGNGFSDTGQVSKTTGRSGAVLEKRTMAAFLSTLSGKVAVAGLLLVVGLGILSFRLRAGVQEQQEIATDAITEKQADEVLGENEETQRVEKADDRGETVQAIAEAVEESEKPLLEQISQLDVAVADMVPAMNVYLDVRSPGETFDESVVMSANDYDVFWTFVNYYTLRYGIREEHYFYSRQEDWEPLCEAVFPDYTGVPDTLDQFIEKNYAEYLDISFENGVYSRLAYGEGEFTGLEMTGWEPKMDDTVDVTINRTFPYSGDVVETLVAHIAPDGDAIKKGNKLKFKIQDAEMTYTMPEDERLQLFTHHE